ncbi:YicC family protein [Arenibacterium halophilum]|uniref:YicC family protein n=2 Tax=Arenibacterium halophilum TaxID=2583821 RepID=A0ABY2XAQ9_9RHOB|nr:YicC family protein [Arenibacterium halophilum]
MIRSMTAFASGTGGLGQHSWTWELRSVNAKGLDLRLRVPDWLDGLEAALRADLGKALSRGSVTLGLRVTRDGDEGRIALNPSTMNTVLDALAEIEAEALRRGMTLAPSRAADLLGVRGMLDVSSGSDDAGPLVAQLKREFPDLVARFLEMRESEGAALEGVLRGQIDQIETLTTQAAALVEGRRAAMAEALQANLARVMGSGQSADPDRVAQELAMIAVKSDVTEEIDRLVAHVAAARELVETGGPIGRKLDFLTQEFNREANTLCSKSQHRELTALGLELKAVIDQMREQVQNVE